MMSVVPIDSGLGQSKDMVVVPLDDDKFDGKQDEKQDEKQEISTSAFVKVQPKQIIPETQTQTRNKKVKSTNIFQMMNDVMNNIFWFIAYIIVVVLMFSAGPIMVTIMYCTRDKKITATASKKKWYWNFIGSVFTTTMFWFIFYTVFKHYI